MGDNPFDNFFIDKTFNYIAERGEATYYNEKRLSSVCKAYSPSYLASTDAYKDIAENIQNLVEEAIYIRNQYSK